MNILKIHAEESGGGANQIAGTLLRGYLKAGHPSQMTVREKNSNWNEIFEVPNEDSRNIFYRQTKAILQKLLVKEVCLLPRVLSGLLPWTEPLRTIKSEIGLEDFSYPGTKHIIKKAKITPDIIHCHSLHSDFFDLNYLSTISLKYPTFITLHDCWMLTGHCVHPYECEQWKTNCTKCPYPTLPIATKRDACKWNQERKKNIYQNSKLYISAPSQWLTRMAENSILAKGSVEFRHIPNGIDDKSFRLGDKKKVRQELGVGTNENIVLFVGNAASKNPTKGFDNLLKILLLLKAYSPKKKITFLVIGDTFEEQYFGENIKLKSIGWIHERDEIVKYYQASDIYLHLANAENFPTAILEAMHCGLPVIGSKVGGIPEQIVHNETGYCFLNNQTHQIINSILVLLDNKRLRAQMGESSKKRAMNLYTEARMVDSYLSWFEEILYQKISKN